ncbi:MAG: hypothetical protein A2908_00565 [Candidatus Staskawiczbacteria bacterium RIFCSPLOWO2_01_FULL_38_12b]|uniref:Uncharacterized protein n=1 Tax=Candidatus Staskawiczbacteria bacterium RIFCSPLOWO2_01_FULL_38_12b TaxID=1802214 RepID=A0A1G2IFN9_9BACT|nr:MAG: hypothetical protein A2908_00565 [Candidatus Staskawiczbacteria bacterium RIFCSPLOWO2_01_FULL_38_12b]
MGKFSYSFGSHFSAYCAFCRIDCDDASDDEIWELASNLFEAFTKNDNQKPLFDREKEGFDFFRGKQFYMYHLHLSMYFQWKRAWSPKEIFIHASYFSGFVYQGDSFRIMKETIKRILGEPMSL